MEPRNSRDTLLDEVESSDRTGLIDRFGRPFSAGETLFREGEPSRDAFLLHEGRVRLLKRVRLADRSLTVLRPGDLFGESALLDATPRGSTAVALTDGIALVFDRAGFMALMQRDPVISNRVVEQLVRRVRDAEDQIEVMMLKDTQSKIVSALLKLAGNKNGPVELSVSPVDLSTRVGLDVDTVKRAVTRLREQNYVKIMGERVEIPDLDALRRLYSLLGSKEELAR
jgi:CRP/FNR family cyclic AMP-dependent transcriptional regulator